jgi:dihydrofolate reductase
MKKLIVSNLMTLDGFIAGPNGELDWFRADEELLECARELCCSIGAILFGRRTYEMMAAYWPTDDAKKSSPTIAERMNNLPKAAVSKTLAEPLWNNSRIIRDRIPESILELKEQADGDIVIFGSGRLVSSLLPLGLIDELRLFVHPAILGRGQPEFSDMPQRIDLELLSAKPFRSGVMLLAYKPSGGR